MKKSRNSVSAFGDLETRIILAAVNRTARVLRPYPDDVDQAALDDALESLRDKGLVQGSVREPNLTRDGIEAANALLAEAV